MHFLQGVAIASILMTTTSALPRFPLAGLFERVPQYETISSFPTLTLAGGATGIVPSGVLTGSGSIGTYPTGTGTGTGLPMYPTYGPISEPLSSFTIATSVDVGPVKAPLTSATSYGEASCPVVTPLTVTETVTKIITQGGAPYTSGSGGATGTIGTVMLPTVTPYHY